jgi:periplasmic protein TonB
MEDVAIQFEETPDEAETVERFDGAYETGVTHPVTAASRLRLFRRLARGYAAAPIAFTAALTVHAAVIAAGFYYLRVMTPPPIERPFGWAVDRDGQGNDGAVPAADSTLTDAQPSQDTFRLPPVSGDVAEPPRQPLGPPPGEFQPPDVRPPDVTLDESLGTAELRPLPATVAGDHTPPAITPRTPPGLGAGDSQSEGSSETSSTDASTGGASPPSAAAPSTPSSPSPASDPAPPDRGTGTARAGDANNDGGGVRGAQTATLDLRSVPIRIPALGYKKRWVGTAVASFTVDDRGRVRDVRITKSSGYDLYDEEVVDALTNRWRPAREFCGAHFVNQQFIFDPSKQN